jgi:hypothetical protein
VRLPLPRLKSLASRTTPPVLAMLRLVSMPPPLRIWWVLPTSLTTLLFMVKLVSRLMTLPLTFRLRVPPEPEMTPFWMLRIPLRATSAARVRGPEVLRTSWVLFWRARAFERVRSPPMSVIALGIVKEENT